MCVVDAVMRLVEDARTLEAAGCFAFVIECVGIGAVSHFSGQVLVYHDMLGLLDHPLKPKVREAGESEK